MDHIERIRRELENDPRTGFRIVVVTPTGKRCYNGKMFDTEQEARTRANSSTYRLGFPEKDGYRVSIERNVGRSE